MENRLNTLRVQFTLPLTQNQIPMFRGAINASMEKANILFHNHQEDNSLRYAYPLIQYKRVGGKAAIVCVGKGTEAIGEFFANCNFDLQLGGEPVRLEVAQVVPAQTLVQVWDDRFDYTLRKWLPLNQENYERYRQLDGLAERCAMLEKLLTGNILSFAKGVGITIEKEIVLKINQLENERTYVHKSVKKWGLDLAFSSNVSLPSFIGLGQGVSVGFGMVSEKRLRNA